MLIFCISLVTPQASLDVPRDLDFSEFVIQIRSLKNLILWNHGNLFRKSTLKMKKILEGPGKKATNLQQIIARDL